MSVVSAEKLRQNLVAMAARAGVVEGDLYRHYRGERVRVLKVAYREDTLQPCVLYIPAENGALAWDRLLSNFTATVTLPGGREVARFTREDD